MPVRPALRVCVTAFPLGGRIWSGGVAHSVCQSEEQFVGELLQDSTFSDGEDIRDSSADPMRVSFVDADRLTFGTLSQPRSLSRRSRHCIDSGTLQR